MPDTCLVCDRISGVINNENPYFVAELETGYVVRAKWQNQYIKYSNKKN